MPIGATIGAAVVGAGASVIGSSNAASASKKAAQTQADAANHAADIEKEIFDIQNAQFAPWRETGANALSQMSALMGLPQVDTRSATTGTAALTTGAAATPFRVIGPNGVNYPVTGDAARYMTNLPSGWSIVPYSSGTTATGTGANSLFQPGNTQSALDANRQTALNSFYTDPGYEFARDEGIQAIDRSAAARGILNSGATAKALERFGQGLADQQYGDYYNRLAGLSGTGQTATQATANAASQYGANAGNALIKAGEANASGYIGAANAFNSGMSGVGNAITGGLNNYFAYAGMGGGGGMPVTGYTPYNVNGFTGSLPTFGG